MVLYTVAITIRNLSAFVHIKFESPQTRSLVTRRTACRWTEGCTRSLGDMVKRLPTPDAAASDADGYTRLLSLFGQTTSSASEEATRSGRKKKKRTKMGAAASAEETALPFGDDAGDHTIESSAQPADTEEDDNGFADQPEEETADAEDADEAKWQSAAYNAHFDVEWSTSQLNERAESLADATWELAGLGTITASTPPQTLQPPQTSSVDLALKGCGVLPALRARWKEKQGGKISPEQRSLLAAVSGYADVMHADASLSSHAQLLPVQQRLVLGS